MAAGDGAVILLWMGLILCVLGGDMVLLDEHAQVSSLINQVFSVHEEK